MNWKAHISNKIKVMRETFRKSKLNNNGFTLIEAIITVAIVGIIVVPITMVYTGSLNDTIEAKDVLKANQMAQLYVENLKVRSYDDIEALFSGGVDTLVLTEATIAENEYLQGLPAIPDNFSVELSIDRSLYSGVADYEISKPTDELEISDADIYIDINYNAVDGVEVYFYNSADFTTPFASKVITASATPYEYDLNISDTVIDISDAYGTIDDDVIPGILMNMSNPNTVIINSATTKADANAELIFNISQNVSTTSCAVYVLRETEDYVYPLVETNFGLVETNYNIMEANPATHFITKIEIKVIKTTTGEELTTMSATKVYD